MSVAAGDWVPESNGGIQAGGDWKARLIPGKKGPAPCLANAITFLRNDPAWVEVFGFDEFAHAVMVTRESPLGGDPRRFGDHEERLVADFLRSEEHTSEL